MTSASPRIGAASATTADEGRRVLRNLVSFGAFAIAPLQMALLSRAFGPSGYGRWWWTFGLLEAMMIVGMLSADLFIRREVPRLLADGREHEIPSVVGSSLSIAAAIGLVFALVAVLVARPLARAQGDPALETFLVVLAAQPLLWNLTNGLAAALQSVNVLGAVAIIRGLVVPMAQVGALWAAWKRGASTHTTLLLLLGVSALALVLVTILYARRLPLGQTVAAALRPRYARAGLRYGLGLLVPSLLWTLGGKLDLYVLGSRVEPALVGVYAACLQVASLLPNTRTLFDPVVQAQVGALHGRGDGELGASLQRLARLCALALGPAFVLLISVGGPILAYLLGHPVPRAALPLAILCAGQLIGSIAVASWLVPMSMPGRLLTIIAGTTLVVKLGLLLLLVPRWALVGAAVATAAGTIIAQQGQALLGGRGLGIRIYPRSLAVVLLAIGAIGAGGRLTYVMLAARLSGPVAAAAAGAGSVLLFIACLPALLEPSERAELAALLGRK